MFARIVCAAALLAAAPLTRTPAAEAAPQRIVSLNLCVDQLLLQLVPPERIASITWLSRSEGDPQLLPLAQRLPVNHGSAEEVLASHPDLVIAGRFTTSATRRLLQKAGVPLLEIDPATDWEGIRRTTREIAAAVQAGARGEELIAAMDADLALLRSRPAHAPVRAIGWGGAADDVPGRDTLFNTILETAGAINLGARATGPASFDIEQVLRVQPQVLLRGAAYAAAPAMRNQIAAHPALRQQHYSVITYPEAVYGCAVPRAAALTVQLADELDRLRQKR
ncbi:MAG TPA: ABC transporter substrate-binding protein [Steroidobacteraceae bacterium]|nr:ABC transporter substrate-binding protein [Steroidobacteraceae bacterium]